ncbi:DUF4426 domain-containing protein [Colwellia sp. 4_MG-2023]|uniref:DUF4426 domain-containing protein n=1 Tax=unclassified Colwellia TaxID=196834 RepID=UPI001C0A5B90|nr:MULTISPECIES: DUF4426 domain-containing protein [unclassified Colwellia]MBU2923179.1 DUF4426 domain-containing protein [Colwellia sp. C2M11]MDO6488350.1 DUF4426 domain-containing protein [Colwellia sp. 6_MG-2023]MDO6506659.1 DUF4426 domain-containing protein [Colwellia sp. 5_MG-2023]MDO6555485.1 DUF4426 domain-containing protein [Colwellia sp. 4_MG-2023]MDO6651392.1 DUF4426 domain-containing protein [Colwellia sp. 3_MG-2023]
MNNLIVKLLLAFTISLLVISSANAENMKPLGSMNVHYMAIGSTFFTPEIAKAYGITRSRYNGLVNISVLDNTKAGHPAKTVSIIGQAKNNLGQFKNLAFEEVKEGDAIYYLAQVSYNDEETLHFTLEINDGKEQQTLTFSQKFYVD